MPVSQNPLFRVTSSTVERYLRDNIVWKRVEAYLDDSTLASLESFIEIKFSMGTQCEKLI